MNKIQHWFQLYMNRSNPNEIKELWGFNSTSSSIKMYMQCNRNKKSQVEWLNQDKSVYHFNKNNKSHVEWLNQNKYVCHSNMVNSLPKHYTWNWTTLTFVELLILFWRKGGFGGGFFFFFLKGEGGVFTPGDSMRPPRQLCQWSSLQ